LSLYSGTDVKAKIADGIVVVFNLRYSNRYDYNDALKMMNANENLSILSNGKLLSLEAKRNVSKKDTVFLSFSNLRRQTYKFKFAPDKFSRSGINIKLIDKFLNTAQSISASDSTLVNFDITTDPGSFASDRFYLVFGNAISASVLSDAISIINKPNSEALTPATGISVFPNPVTEGRMHLVFSGIKPGKYQLSLTDQQGRLVKKQSFFKVEGVDEMIMVIRNLQSGEYLLAMIGEKGFSANLKVMVK
jgi:hypothetical protein